MAPAASPPDCTKSPQYIIYGIPVASVWLLCRGCAARPAVIASHQSGNAIQQRLLPASESCRHCRSSPLMRCCCPLLAWPSSQASLRKEAQSWAQRTAAACGPASQWSEEKRGKVKRGRSCCWWPAVHYYCDMRPPSRRRATTRPRCAQQVRTAVDILSSPLSGKKPASMSTTPHCSH